jgi:hypothetical protein
MRKPCTGAILFALISLCCYLLLGNSLGPDLSHGSRLTFQFLLADRMAAPHSTVHVVCAYRLEAKHASDTQRPSSDRP